MEEKTINCISAEVNPDDVSSVSIGDLYYDSTTGTTKVYNTTVGTSVIYDTSATWINNDLQQKIEKLEQENTKLKEELKGKISVRELENRLRGLENLILKKIGVNTELFGK